MPTPFAPHQDGDIIYASHVNELQTAIQEGEKRIVRVGDDLFTQKALLALATLEDADFAYVDTFQDTSKIERLIGVVLSPEDKWIALRPGYTTGSFESALISSPDWASVSYAYVIYDADPKLGQVRVYASNDSGITWVMPDINGKVVFNSSGGSLKLKAELARYSEAYESPVLLNWAVLWGVANA